MNDVVNTVKSSLDVFNDIDLDEVLSLAEIIASFAPIPGLPLVMKMLRVISKTQKVTKAISPVAFNIYDNVSGSVANHFGDTGSGSPKKEVFAQMMDIALADGVVTADEKAFLLPRALEAGYTEAQLDMMISKGINKL